MKNRLLRGVSLLSVLAICTYLVAISSSPGFGQGGLLQTGGLPQQTGALPPAASNGLPPLGQSVPSAAPGNNAVVAVAPAHVGSAGSSMMASALLSNGTQQIVIYDHAKQTMAVYQIHPTSGDIQLKGVRKLDADFALQEFNLSSPTPSDIRQNVR